MLKTYIPWWIKLSAKVVLSRLPIPYNFWKSFALISHGSMDEPSYAYQVFIQHFNRFQPPKKDFVSLELGPGDSLFSALISKALGGKKSYLVDVSDFASKKLAKYQPMTKFLKDKNLPIEGIENCQNLTELLKLCSASYLTSGLESLKDIPDCSVDFIWSHGVIELIKRAEVLDTLKELRRIIKPNGICSHLIPLVDSLGELNSLRFSQNVWESDLMANSGFYANRIRYSQLLELFKEAGFTAEVVEIKRWDELPTPKSKLSEEFSTLSDEELKIYSFSVILQPA
jgi:SAM-dependent methyltransferase